MQKLKLNLNDLKVESFETTKKEKKVKGTVVGYWQTRPDQTICNPTGCDAFTCSYPHKCLN